MVSKKQANLSPAEAKQAAKALEVLFASEYIDKKQLYKANFIRGIFFSVGSVVGVTIVVTLLAWLLSITPDIPFVKSVSENIKHSIEKK